MSLVALIDYGSGNLRSAAKAFERAAREAGLADTILVTDDPRQVRRADRVVLPGVGAFADCKRGLDALPGMVEALTETVTTRGRPFLGICVGMQLMAEWGLEHGKHAGLGWIGGQVVAVEPSDAALKVPHMGWNELQIPPAPHALLAGLAPGSHAYFVHSYHFDAAKPAEVLATVDYGGPLTAVIGRDNLVGTQFHPEKSQATGLAVITNFLTWRP
ncbi:imidazole glycerol phosphate synthase subunit HisH [Telmatospirillum siberiense]|uniref:Imidazole glycerol phosphate synthase subunit HisH n=1 Tax=Telmatospirillum siberiense TaxID=382514 RepID=A0A2N3PSX5_9PROT|nr:imidazole glycerol phosphate synthase subunit HisH [Telmatospirillum siberiense]PKU23494.1 imidazole glycerol phosphate synthase subunit HisH [Telmatospirillum siberiense]